MKKISKKRANQIYVKKLEEQIDILNELIYKEPIDNYDVFYNGYGGVRLIIGKDQYVIKSNTAWVMGDLLIRAAEKAENYPKIEKQ